jgi:hypothetical protein
VKSEAAAHLAAKRPEKRKRKRKTSSSGERLNIYARKFSRYLRKKKTIFE